MIQSKKNIFLALASFFLIGFFILTILVIKGLFLPIDKYIDQTLPYSKSSFFYYSSRFIANLYLPLLGVITLLIFWFKRRKQRFEILMLLASFSGWTTAELLLKPIFEIQCPNTYYSNVITQKESFYIPLIQRLALQETCYPSGHTVSYIVFFGYLIFLTFLYIKKAWLKRTIITGLSFIILLVGPSRIYLHVHWFSDVIAAYLLGLAILIFLILFRIRHLEKSQL
ncbi:phosphatase PAP2 family protein [Candidatus Daviesbacteria bacterium]|nr:phosphatase PAP2 family protein [Candidatus Daviesbacteria bacterium]